MLGFDDSKQGETRRRHQGSCNRLILGNVDAIHKGRRAEAAEQDARRKVEDGIEANRDERRLILDENGAVRYESGSRTIQDEEGRARYEAARGRSRPVGTTDSPCEIDNIDIPRFPDFAL